MKKLLKLMLQNNMLRMPEGDPANGEDGANGGGADKGNDLSAEIAALKEQIAAFVLFYPTRKAYFIYLDEKKGHLLGTLLKCSPSRTRTDNLPVNSRSLHH